LQNKWISISLTLKLFFCDVVAGLFLALLVVDDPRRAPFLVIAIPLLICANALVVWIKRRTPASITLPAVYGFGLIWGILWTATQFEWWKLPLLLMPAALLYASVQRFRRDSLSGSTR
jgi:hypothetical protein